MGGWIPGVSILRNVGIARSIVLVGWRNVPRGKGKPLKLERHQVKGYGILDFCFRSMIPRNPNWGVSLDPLFQGVTNLPSGREISEISGVLHIYGQPTHRSQTRKRERLKIAKKHIRFNSFSIFFTFFQQIFFSSLFIEPVIKFRVLTFSRCRPGSETRLHVGRRT